MGKRRGGAPKSGVAQAKDPEASSSPADEVAEPLGVLWTWTPDVEPTAAVEPPPDVEPTPDVEPVETPPASLAERVADVVREVEDASGVVTSTDPSVGVLWTWTPPPAEPAAPPEEPAAAVGEPAAEQPRTSWWSRNGRASRWSDTEQTAETAPVVESEPEAVAEDPGPPAESAADAPAEPPAEQPRTSRWSRNGRASRWSDRDQTAETAPVVLPEPEPELQPEPVAESAGPPAEPPTRQRRAARWSRNERSERSNRTVETTPVLLPDPEHLPPPVLTPVPDDELTTVRAVMTLDPTLVLPPPPMLAPPIYGDSIDDEIWDRVSPVRLPSRGSVRVALGALAIAVCAALPWVVPQIPDLFAGAVPDQVHTSITSDPPIDPPPTAPPTPNDSLAGKRLASAGTPLEVTVQRLHVHSDVVPISGADGELVPPNDPQILGWWQEGRGVGAATGSAVVTGHTVNKGGGAFDHLGELVPGDQITVRTKAGTIEYVVRESHDVSVGELARTSASIFRQDGPGRLVLITCSDFNGTVYLSNAIVYASPIADRPLQRK